MFTMPLRRTKRLLAAAALLGATTQAGAALLYDASLNSLPSAQGWSSITVGGTATISASGGVYSLDTSSADVVQSGNFTTLAAGLLDTVIGFDLSIGLNLVTESHAANANRAGFSLLLLGDDQSHALELAFWSDTVWAYTSTFTQGPAAQAQTGGGMHDYRVSVRNNGYTVYRDGASLLSGALVDYPGDPFPALTSVYNRPRTIFFGDDTKSANANVQISYVSLTAVPLPGALGLCLLPAWVLGRRRRRR